MAGNSEIRILHLIDSSDLAGGQRYLLDLVKHSDPVFKHCLVLSGRGPFVDMLRDQNCKYVFISMKRKFSLDSILKIRRLIRAEKIHIVHTHGYRANLYGRLAGLWKGINHIATVHVSLYDYIGTAALFRRFYILIERMTSSLTSRYICISAAMKNDLLKMNVRDDKIVVIHNGVDLDVFKPRPADKSLSDALGIGQSSQVIGTVGRMVTEKGQIFLIEALALLRDRWPMLRCIFVGAGPLLAQLKKQAGASGLSDMCIFAGVRMDVADIYPLMDIFVLPSIREPFGLVLLEAMASRIPVIATSSGGPPDFIKSGVNGFLVSPSNPEELALKIDFLLSHPEQSGAVAKRGRDTVAQYYSIKETAAKIGAVYRSLTACIE